MPARCGYLLAALLASSELAPMFLPAVATAQSAAVAFNIPAQPLPTALVAFYQQSGIQLLYDGATTEGRQSPGLSGQFTTQEALGRLLTGTGLSYRFTTPTTVTLTAIPQQQGVLQVPEVSVEGARYTSTMGALPPLLPGGQVASGGRLGTLGNRDVMDTPFSQTSFTSQFISNQQAQSVAAVVSSDPAVRLGDQTNNGNANSFSMRGIFLGNGSIGFDGMFGLAPNSQSTLIGIERVEVLRGPSAFLTGMSPSGVGGAINLVPKGAGAEPQTDVTLSYLSDARFGTHLDMGRRYGERQEWGVRGNLFYRNGDTGVDGQSQEVGVATLGLDYRGERLRLSGDFGYQKLETDRANITITPTAGVAVPEPPSQSRSYVSPWNFTNFQDQFRALRAEYDILPDLTAYVAAGMSHTDWNQVLDAGTAVQSNGNFLQNSSYNQITIDRQTGEAGLRARAQTGPVQHSMAFGVSGYRAVRDAAPNPGLFTTSLASNLYNPVFRAEPSRSQRSSNKQSDTSFSSLAFSDTLSILEERVQLTLGLRQQNVEALNFNINSGAKTSKYEQDALTPVVGLLVKSLRNVSLYASYIEALQQGGIVGNTYTNAGEALAPFLSRQYEVGAKVDFGAAIATLSAFHITQESGIADLGSNTYRADGEQRFRGVELSVMGEPLKGVRLIAGAMFLDAETTKSQGGPL